MQSLKLSVQQNKIRRIHEWNVFDNMAGLSLA